MQAHLGADLFQGVCQELCRFHPVFLAPKGLDTYLIFFHSSSCWELRPRCLLFLLRRQQLLKKALHHPRTFHPAPGNDLKLEMRAIAL